MNLNSRLFALMLGAFMLLAFGGCKQEEPVLHIYTWADYIKPELVRRFEQQFSCRVVIDTFDSNEAMYEKLKGGAGGYDLITPSSYMVKIMFDQGMLQPLNKSKIPNSANVDPEFLAIAIDRYMDHSIPYMISYTGVAYLEDQVPDFKPTWAMFEREDLRGRMTMLNDMRETIGAALKHLGFSINSVNDKELEQARDVVIRWKKNLAKFENEQYNTGLASKQYVMVHGYSGDILKSQKENEKIVFALPEEGFSIASDDLVIPKTAKEVDLAHKFINFLHDPKVAAQNTEFITYLCPNRASYPLLSPEVKKNPGIVASAGVRARGEVIKDLGRDNEKYVKVWNAVKAAAP